VAAVGELEVEYEGRVRFEIVSAAETAARAAEIAQYELGSHGLVAFDAAGVERAHIPGHEFGRKEIVAAIEAALR
jgi:hypothetical protein